MKKLRCGLLGATGLAGQQFVSALKNHPWFELTAIAASPRSAGKTYSDALKAPNGMMGWLLPETIPSHIAEMTVQAGDTLSPDGLDVIFSAVESDVAIELEPRLARAIPVISAASAFRYEKDVPLLIPPINAGACLVARAAAKRPRVARLHRPNSQLHDDGAGDGARSA